MRNSVDISSKRSEWLRFRRVTSTMIHALVGHSDGGLIAHVGPPDMRHAIGYALHWPERRELPVARLDLAEIGALTFRAPEDARYPALRLARWVMEEGGLAGAVFTAAKEAALDGFIAGRIGFLDMATIVEKVIENLSGDGLGKAAITLDTLREADQIARMHVTRLIDQKQA